jgi:hypothetical protein
MKIFVMDLPATTAPMDRPTFASMLMATLVNCRFSIMLFVSRAKEDIVVNEPQNPIAINNEYLASRFQIKRSIENIPRIKLPITLMIRILIGNVPSTSGDSAIFHRTKAPSTAPAASNANSIPFIFSCLPLVSNLVGIISTFAKRAVLAYAKANAIAILDYL